MDATSSAIKTGTSTVGITYDGGVVVGADHRATLGHFIANKSVQKLFRISDNIGFPGVRPAPAHPGSAYIVGPPVLG